MTFLRTLAVIATAVWLITWLGCPPAIEAIGRAFAPRPAGGRPAGDPATPVVATEAEGPTLLSVLQEAESDPAALPRLLEGARSRNVATVEEAEALVRVLARFPRPETPALPEVPPGRAVPGYDPEALTRLLEATREEHLMAPQAPTPTDVDGRVDPSALLGGTPPSGPWERDAWGTNDTALWAACNLLCSAWEDAGHEYLLYHGTNELIRIADELMARPDRPAGADLLATLRALAYLEVPQGTSRIVDAAAAGLRADDPAWRVVLMEYYESHTQIDHAMAGLRDARRTGWLGVALLEMANRVQTDGWAGTHLYADPAGLALLEDYLDGEPGTPPADAPASVVAGAADRAERADAAALAAAEALALIDGPDVLALIHRGLVSANGQVRRLAAQAGLARRDRASVDSLVAACHDVHTAAEAKSLLGEAGLAGLIPAPARDPDFSARADVSFHVQQWYDGKLVPEELTVLDSRELQWPASGDRRRLALVRFRMPTTTAEALPAEDGVALVGGELRVAVRFEFRATQPVKDLYALYLCHEMRWTENPGAPRSESVSAGRRLLRRTNPDF